jgi:hypothetical protein
MGTEHGFDNSAWRTLVIDIGLLEVSAFLHDPSPAASSSPRNSWVAAER